MLTTGKIANPYFNCYFTGAGKIATAIYQSVKTNFHTLLAGFTSKYPNFNSNFKQGFI